MNRDRMFQPQVASDLAKKAVGPKSVWIPVVENSLKICGEYGKKKPFSFSVGFFFFAEFNR